MGQSVRGSERPAAITGFEQSVRKAQRPRPCAGRGLRKLGSGLLAPRLALAALAAFELPLVLLGGFCRLDGDRLDRIFRYDVEAEIDGHVGVELHPHLVLAE